jgi:hypothetical protein
MAATAVHLCAHILKRTALFMTRHATLRCFRQGKSNWLSGSLLV